MFAFIGTGIMGKEMVIRLLENNFDVTVYNRTAAKAEAIVDSYANAKLAASPAEAVEKAKFIFIMLSDDTANEEMFFHPENGLASKITKDRIVVNLSTISPSLSLKLSQSVQGDYLEAPVAGSRVPAKNGELIILAGGSKEIYEELLPVWKVWAKKTVYCGAVPQAAKYKLVNNFIMCLSLNALAEGLSLAHDLNLNIETLDDIIHSGPFTNPMFQLKEKAMLSKNFETHFPLAHARKDLDYALDLTETPLTVGKEVRKVYHRTEEDGAGRDDFSSIYKYYQP